LSANNLSWFTRAAKRASRAAGRPWTFIAANEEPEAIREYDLKLARRARTRVKRDKDGVAIEVEDRDGKSQTVKKKSGGK
jgi:hypothetical protein